MEFCTAVAVVVTGVTVIYMANNARGNMHLREDWAPIGGHISTLLRRYEAIVRSFCDLLDMLFISTTKSVERCKRN